MDDLVELLKDPDVHKQYALLPPELRAAFDWRCNWLAKAHDHQIMPPGDWWAVYLCLAGRGAGKTRMAAEQVGWWAWSQPNTRWLVAAPTSADVRGTCYEGDSGLLEVIPKVLVEDYNKTAHELRLINGSLIKGIPASEPERFRGPQFHGAWCCIPGTMIALPHGDAKPIEDIRAGDIVMTRHGAREVSAAGVSGNPNELVAIDCGVTSLTVTADHPILIEGRWIPAGEIRKGDQVCLAINTSEGAMPIESSTNSTLAQYQKAGLSIIETKTNLTITQTTSSQCLGVSISRTTQVAGSDQKPSVWRRPALWLPSALQSLRSAFAVAMGLCLTPLARWGSFAQGLALKSGGITASRQSNATALSAQQSTPQSSDSRGTVAEPVTTNLSSAHTVLTKTEVLSVERLPNSLTYSLTVEGEHEFIANHIVVHNCDELAAWDYLQAAWDQIQFGVRLGKQTKIICTTTPRPKDLIVELIGREGDDVAVRTASTYSNLDNLSANFKKQILSYEGTTLGRQEIYAEIIDPEESGIVKREMFQLWPADKEFPKFEYILQSYDCAYTEKTVNDPTAAITFGCFKPLDGPMSVMVIDCWQDRLQYPDLRPKVIEEYDIVFGEGVEKKRVDLILVEDKAAGISLIQDLQRAHLPVRAYNPGRADKIQRLSIVSNIIARKRVWIPESTVKKGYVRDWAEPFVSQICAFPETTHDDFVDACTQALRYLRDSRWLDIDGPPPEDYDQDDYVDSGRGKQKGNPYAA
jgi:predicted phage terminase large subunit-like protein